MTNDELRAIAEAATPGPWHTEQGNGIFADRPTMIDIVDEEPSYLVAWCHSDWRDEADARYIATFDPRRALAACDLADATADLDDYPQSPEALAKLRAARKAWEALA